MNTDLTQIVMLIFIAVYIAIIAYFLSKILAEVFAARTIKWMVEKAVEVAKE
jgi:hypothetical protein